MIRATISLEELVAALGVHTPTSEQSAVITHPLAVTGKNGLVPAPMLVVAGAGSGKTETMSLRAVYLVASTETTPDEILGLTFTRKAAAELEERLTGRLGQLRSWTNPAAHDLAKAPLEFDEVPVATTYNSFALDVVREFGALIGQGTDISHLDSAASWQLMQTVVEEWKNPLSGDSSMGAVVDQALSLREAITNQGLTTVQIRPYLEMIGQRFVSLENERKLNNSSKGLFAFELKAMNANIQRLELLDIIEEFESRKQQLGRMDFADQVLVATRIIEQIPAVRSELRRRHKVVFLDEFQDTSVAQMKFLSALFSDHPVTAVGDPNQAIYGWRGASAASLDDFHRLFTTNPDAPKTVKNLSTAWRNSTDILKVANQIAKPLRDVPVWIDNPNFEGTPSPILESRVGADKGLVQADYVTTSDQQIERIVRFVTETYDAIDEQKKPSVAILCRRRTLIPAILEALHEAGFAAETNGVDGLLFHPAVLDIRASLEIANDIGKSSSLMRLMTNLDLGAADLWKLGSLATKIAKDATGEHHPLVLLIESIDAIGYNSGLENDSSMNQVSEIARGRIKLLAEKLRRIRRATDRTIVEQVEYARYVLNLDAEALAVGNLSDVSEVLDAFGRAAANYQAVTIAPTMSGFLKWLQAAEDKEQGLQLPTAQPNPEAIQVMTIHASKGLEWDAVAVVDMEMGVFPSYRGKAISEVKQEMGESIVGPPPIPPGQLGWWAAPGQLPYPVREDKRHLPDPPIWDANLKSKEIESLFREDVGAYLLAEERRLAYVAVTRPRHRLFLLGSWLTGGKTCRYPSVFLTEATNAIDENNIADDKAPSQSQLPGQWAKCPEPSEIEELVKTGEASSFPKPPGKARKAVALSAARVEQVKVNLELDSSSYPDVQQILASVSDQKLVEKVRILIEEDKQQRDRRESVLLGRAIQDVRTALSTSLMELSATRINSLANSESLWLDLRRPIPEKPFAGSVLGTAFHQWVESELRKVSASRTETVDAFSSFLPNKEVEDDNNSLLSGNAEFMNDSEDLLEERLIIDEKTEKRLEEMKNTFKSIEWIGQSELLGVEVSFAIEHSDLLVRGRIDAVFWVPSTQEYWLVDWKTGRPPTNSNDINELANYLTQLSVYEKAWKRKVGDTVSVKTKLVFIGETKTVEVTGESLAEQYEAATNHSWSLDSRINLLKSKLYE